MCWLPAVSPVRMLDLQGYECAWNDPRVLQEAMAVGQDPDCRRQASSDNTVFESRAQRGTRESCKEHYATSEIQKCRLSLLTCIFLSHVQRGFVDDGYCLT